MSHRKFIISQYESGSWYPHNTVASAAPGKGKRPAEDEDDDEKTPSTKRRNINNVADYAQGSTPTSPHIWHINTQDGSEQVSNSSLAPHPSSRAYDTLRIQVPKPERRNIPCIPQQFPDNPCDISSLSLQQPWDHYPSCSMPGSMSDWRFISPHSYSPALSPPSLEMTRSVLRASSSYDVQWHRESRQHSFAEHDDYSHRVPIALRRYATSPSSPLFPPFGAMQDAIYSSEEEEENNFEPGSARSVSPEPFSRRDSLHVPECVTSSSLANNTSVCGKRRALIIAVEYREVGQIWKNTSINMGMHGPYNDGQDIYRLLVEQGYQEHEITIMTDSPNSPTELQPTCNNIKYQLGRLVVGAAPGDRFFLYYAGHAIIPSDWVTAYNYSDQGLIIDDYLKEVCVDPLPKGAHLTAVFDCCHAGTIMDLTYEHSTKRSSPGFKLNRLTGLSSRRLPSRFRSVDGRVLCISACEDNQRAFASHQRGLLTKAFTRCIRMFTKSYEAAGVTFRFNPTLKRLYEYLIQYGRPDPQRYGNKYIQDPMLATTFRLSAAEYHRPLLI